MLYCVCVCVCVCYVLRFCFFGGLVAAVIVDMDVDVVACDVWCMVSRVEM